MKKSKKILSVLLSVIIAIGCLSSGLMYAFADATILTIIAQTEDGKRLDGVEYSLNYVSENGSSLGTIRTDENGKATVNIYSDNSNSIWLNWMPEKHHNYFNWDDTKIYYNLNLISNSGTLIITYPKVHSSIIFDTNGGNDIDMINGLDNIPDNLPIPTKDGYVFTGWYYDGDLKTPVIVGETLTDDTTIYTGWECLHTLDYDYTSNNDIHEFICNICGYTEIQDHNFENGICGECQCIDLSNTEISLEYSDVVYNGNEFVPEVTVTAGESIVDNSLYSVTYTDNIKPGTATVTISSNSESLVNSNTATFTIEKANQQPYISVSDGTYGHGPHYLVSDYPEDAEITHTFFDSDGNELDYIPTGIGNYKMVINVSETELYKAYTYEAEFSILPKDINANSVVIEFFDDHSFRIDDIAIECRLFEDVDYTVSITENDNQMIITINGIGNYTGTVTKIFDIPRNSNIESPTEQTTDVTETTTDNKEQITRPSTEKTTESTTKETQKQTTVKTNNSTKSPNTGNGFEILPYAVVSLLMMSLIVVVSKKNQKVEK